MLISKRYFFFCAAITVAFTIFNNYTLKSQITECSESNALNTLFINFEEPAIDRKINTSLTYSEATYHKTSSINPAAYDGPFDQIDKNTSANVTLLHGHTIVSEKRCGSEIELTVIVISEPQEFEQRETIRRTWASEKNLTTLVIFHVGLLNDSTKRHEIESRLKQEIANYSDVFVSDIVEYYYNLSLKTYGSLMFVAKYCKYTTCTIKSDMDTVLNLPALERLCKECKIINYFTINYIGKENKFSSPATAASI